VEIKPVLVAEVWQLFSSR